MNVIRTLNPIDMEERIHELEEKPVIVDYEELENLPSLNGVEFKGDLTSGDVKLSEVKIVPSGEAVTITDLLTMAKEDESIKGFFIPTMSFTFQEEEKLTLGGIKLDESDKITNTNLIIDPIVTASNTTKAFYYEVSPTMDGETLRCPQIILYNVYCKVSRSESSTTQTTTLSFFVSQACLTRTVYGNNSIIVLDKAKIGDMGGTVSNLSLGNQNMFLNLNTEHNITGSILFLVTRYTYNKTSETGTTTTTPSDLSDILDVNIPTVKDQIETVVETAFGSLYYDSGAAISRVSSTGTRGFVVGPYDYNQLPNSAERWSITATNQYIICR